MIPSNAVRNVRSFVMDLAVRRGLGESVEAIASSLNVRPDVIRGWLRAQLDAEVDVDGVVTAAARAASDRLEDF